MSKSRFVIPYDVLPTKLPTPITLIAYIYLDYYQAPSWVWGVVGAILGLVWFSAIVNLIRDKHRPLHGYGERDE